MNYTLTTATTKHELQQILHLQHQNLKSSLTEEEREREGFVTVQHNYALLKKMNEKCPHIIAKVSDEVIGYALSMHPIFANEIPILQPMFVELQRYNITHFLAMGQICISKAHRNKGVFKGLYRHMQTTYKNMFTIIATEIDAANKRSLGAHEALGFKKLGSYLANDQQWILVTLNT
jgi:GNAT superfamily N-acetyltransferase